VGNLEGKKPVGTSRRSWVNIIKVDLTEIEFGYIGRTDLAQDRDWWSVLVNIVINISVPYNVGKFLSSSITDDFSARFRSMKLVSLLNS
jgi:hypothetical protein